MNTPRHLTKSRFKLGMECPAKLFYTGKEALYANQKLEDSFLEALAEGGFQVGELAKAYFPGGQEIEAISNADAQAQTEALLNKPEVVLFEAAVRFENFFLRADVLVKKDGVIDLIEVKSKSYSPEKDGDFLKRNGGIDSGWLPYMLDVAFQKYVLTQAFPDMQIRAWLMLVDKSTTCPSEGLHQRFRIRTDAKGRKKAVLASHLRPEELASKILRQIPVDDICTQLLGTALDVQQGPTSFVERAQWFADHYSRDEKIHCTPSVACASCEFRAKPEDHGLKCGFKECWKEALHWPDEKFLEPNILDIWNYRGKSKLIADGRLEISDVTEADIKPKADGDPGLSASERQWLQVQKARAKDDSVYVEKAALRQEMKRWVYPLHFIDFETTRVAIPFNKGRRPYDMVAFQYSHHVVHEDGSIEHKGQYLNAKRGVFPNYDFVRRLKAELDGDNGSIFRYAAHENSTLLEIHQQLADDPAPPEDREALQAFIRSITTSNKDHVEAWDAPRTMIDLCKLVKRFYYAPATNGSNSIKAVLPAVLNYSVYLQKKYSQPVYGAANGIPSLNFTKKAWIQMEAGRVRDPYKLLPRMFTDVSEQEEARLTADDELREGGAAMTAYARMQFEEMSEQERAELQAALLRYCELDTFAMVLLYEAWRELLG